MSAQLNLPVVADVDHAIDISQLQRRQEREQRRQQLADFLDAIYADDYGSNEKEHFARIWEEQFALWLSQRRSDHTRRAYSNAMAEFKAYLWTQHAIRYLWMVEQRHAVMWLRFMLEVGNAMVDSPKPLSERTANLRLAAVSSFYSHMADATRMVNGDQIGLFVSANGHPRQNPFRSSHVERPRVNPYGNSRPIPLEAYQWILERLAEKPNKSLADIRDFALLKAFIMTGYRADSMLRMQWKDFSPAVDSDKMTYYWRGKGEKEKRKVIDEEVWAAITAYLKADGRYIPGYIIPADDMYIWQPVRRHGIRNLALQRHLAAGHRPEDAEMLADEELAERGRNRPIAQSSANGILRRHLRRYYIQKLRNDGMTHAQASSEAKRLVADYHLHSIRHTFANMIDDLALAQEALDHTSIQTTRVYKESIKDPEDKVSAIIKAKLGI